MRLKSASRSKVDILCQSQRTSCIMQNQHDGVGLHQMEFPSMDPPARHSHSKTNMPSRKKTILLPNTKENKRDNSTPSCTPCQRRHIKCGRQHPCGTCLRTRRHCFYLPRARKPGRQRTAGQTPKAIQRESVISKSRQQQLKQAQDKTLTEGPSIGQAESFHGESRRIATTYPAPNHGGLGHSASHFSVARRMAEYRTLRARRNTCGSQPHNAVLVGMSDGDWPPYCPSNTAIPL